MTRPVVWSASSLSRYIDCELSWYFSYVLLHPGKPKSKPLIGIAVHDAAARILKDHLDGKTVDIEAARGAFWESWGVESLRLEDTPEEVAKATASGLACIDTFVTSVLPSLGRLDLIESAFQIEVDGIPYSGYIDYTEGEGVDDLKTTGSRPRPGKYRLPMFGYALGKEDLTGKPATHLRLDWIVRTKTPYYWPETVRSGPIDDLDFELFASSLEEADAGVERGSFEATGLDKPIVCAACPHSWECGPYQRMQEELNANRD